MTVRLIIVPNDELQSVEMLTEQLVNAVNIGDISTADQLSNKLLSLTDGNRSLTLNEETWNDLIISLRTLDKSYRSDYIISDHALISKAIAEFKGLSVDIQQFLRQALSQDCVVLQLPIEYEVDCV